MFNNPTKLRSNSNSAGHDCVREILAKWIMKILIPWSRYPPFDERRISGISVALWELTNHLKRRGADVDVIVPGEHEETLTLNGVSIVKNELGQKLTQDRQLNPDEKKFLENYDSVLSIQNASAGSLDGGIEFRCITRQIHNVVSATNLSYALTLKPSLRERISTYAIRNKYKTNERKLMGTKTICVSDYLARLMIESKLESAENVVKIPNGVDRTKFFHKDSEKIYDILFIGNFYWVKGLDLLLKSLNLICKKGTVLSLAIAGSFTDSEKDYLLSLTDQAQRAKIQFLGVAPREKVASVINLSRLVCIPSRYEMFGLVALESIACGTPVVANSVGGLPEIIDESVGSLVLEVNPAVFSKKVLSSLADRSLEEGCIRNGPTRARNYDWNIIAEKTLEVLNRD